MSVQLMAQVWRHSTHKGSDLLLMLALADIADDKGICWPSIPTLAKKTRVSERATYSTIGRLLASRELLQLREGGGRQSNLYQINPWLGDDDASGGDVDDRAPLFETSPEPSIEPSVKAEEGRKVVKGRPTPPEGSMHSGDIVPEAFAELPTPPARIRSVLEQAAVEWDEYVHSQEQIASDMEMDRQAAGDGLNPNY